MSTEELRNEQMQTAHDVGVDVARRHIFLCADPTKPKCSEARRSLVAWMGASALYVALLSLFLNLLMRARESDSTGGMIAFGFLVAFFSVGLVLSVSKAIGQARGAGGSGPSATH